MRLMARNGRTIYYQLLASQSPITEEWDTGEDTYVYDSPVAITATVSPAEGSTSRTAYGASPNYDRIVLIDDMDCPVEETSLLWLEREPEYVNEQLANRPDFMVVRVAKALNHIKVVARKL